MSGKYICIEGPDGSGKSTLCSNIFTKLGPDRAEQKRFPSDGTVGTIIREALMGRFVIDQRAFLYLFAADGIQENESIAATLAKGEHVICDRHPTLSGRIFQPEHHELEDIEAVYEAAANDGIAMPDALFVIDVPVATSLQRMASREKYKDVVYEKDDTEYMERLRQRYLDLAKRFGAVVLNGRDSMDELTQQVIQIAGL